MTLSSEMLSRKISKNKRHDLAGQRERGRKSQLCSLVNYLACFHFVLGPTAHALYYYYLSSMLQTRFDDVVGHDFYNRDIPFKKPDPGGNAEVGGDTLPAETPDPPVGHANSTANAEQL